MSAFKTIPSFAKKLPQFENHAQQQTRYTTCYMCACRCGIKVTLENERIRFIQGTPRHPVNRGVLCAKGAAGIMKQYSPAKLRKPLLRQPGADRGESAFTEISWDEALQLLEERLRRIRASDPKRLAFFTGRDQLQAMTGLWAMQFGTINWAAHGGFCSVNMAAAGLYTVGHSFWEFSEPDFDRTKYFMLWGVAEDHSSNPIKLGIEKVKRSGGKFVVINPVQTGYGAIADEWVPIRPGTDGMLALSMVHVLLKSGRIDWNYLVRFTNAPHLVLQDPGAADDGMPICSGDAPEHWRFGRQLVWDVQQRQLVDGTQPGVHPALLGEYQAPDSRPVKTVLQLMFDEYLDEKYAPENAADVCGLPAGTIERLALETADVAFDQSFEIPCEWTDWAGRKHRKYTARPVSMHAMRGISAHSNGFQTCRAIHLLQVLLGSIGAPGGHRSKPPYPKRVPPGNKPSKETAPNTPLKDKPIGFPTRPEDLCVDDQGRPLRLDKAFSWEAPLAAHGLIQNVIRNAAEGDPYPIDTLMLFMANLSWNSSMNIGETMDQLRARGEDGEYKIPFIVVSDAFDSEIVSFADLVLPDTTYLERYDCLSLLDRPPTEGGAIVDSVRLPVLQPDRDVRSFQDVLVELANRLEFPAFMNEDGTPRFRDYKSFIVGYEKTPGTGFLAGWRGADGSEPLTGAPNPQQWERYEENQGFFRYELPLSAQHFKFANQEYLALAKRMHFIRDTEEPILLQLYSIPLQRLRLAGLGQYPGLLPPEDRDLRERLVNYVTPLPSWHPPLEQMRLADGDYPFYAVTQRPMMQYHSWDSQNAWLRQILSHNYLYMNRQRGREMGIRDGDWVWMESPLGRLRVPVRLMEGTQRETVWTWNAIGKRPRTWGLRAAAPESQQGFLLNWLIDDRLRGDGDAHPWANADPVTGMAAWYDLRVRISKAPAGETGLAFIPAPVLDLPGETAPPQQVRHHTHKPVNLRRGFFDTLFRRL